MNAVVVKEELIPGFEILKALGSGSFATAYLVRDTRLNVLRVAKVLSEELARSTEDDYVALFFQEAQALALISDKNVARVYSCATTADGRPYFVMEYLAGQDLERVIADQKGRPIAVLNAVNLAICIFDGLAAAHRVNIVHRDIKPSNVLIVPVGTGDSLEAKLIDFGTFSVSGHIEVKGERVVFRGTYRYAAPELFCAEPATPACDIYSTGVLLYELLAGHTPFHRYGRDDFNALMNAHLTEAPRPISELRSDVPEPLARIIHACLAKKPELRPKSAEACADRLRDIKDALDHAATETRALTYRSMELRGRDSVARRLQATRRISSSRFIREDEDQEESEEGAPTGPEHALAPAAYDANQTDVDGERVAEILREVLGPAPEFLPPEDAVRYEKELNDVNYGVPPHHPSARVEIEPTKSSVAVAVRPSPQRTQELALSDAPPPPKPLFSLSAIPTADDSSENVYVPSPADEAAPSSPAIESLQAASPPHAPRVERELPSADHGAATPSKGRKVRWWTSPDAREVALLVSLVLACAGLLAATIILLRPTDDGVTAAPMTNAPALPAPTVSVVHAERRAPATPSATPIASASASTAPPIPVASSSAPRPKPATKKKPEEMPAWLKGYEPIPRNEPK